LVLTSPTPPDNQEGKQVSVFLPETLPRIFLIGINLPYPS
jgi:hypothetical protein